MKHRQALAIGACALLMSAASYGDTIYTFSAAGTTEGIAQRGTAIFDFASPTQLSITLSDDVAPTTFFASALVGLSFTFFDAPSGQGLDSVDLSGPSPVIDCSNAPAPCPAGSGSTPYGWSTTLNGNTISLGAGMIGSSLPYAIVNSSYASAGDGTGLSDPLFNPLLVGPVTFNLTLQGFTSTPDIASVNFLFGVVPDSQAGRCVSVPCGDDVAVPEPQSLALVSLGLVILAYGYRRRSRSARSTVRI